MADSEEPEKTISDESVVGKYAAAAEISNRKSHHHTFNINLHEIIQFHLCIGTLSLCL